MLRPFGLGIVVFIGICIVAIDFILSITLARSSGIPAVFGLNVLNGLILFGLYSWPVKDVDEIIKEVIATDVIFIPRLCILIFLIIVLIYICVKLGSEAFKVKKAVLIRRPWDREEWRLGTDEDVNK